jgi:hypothetical protein
MPGPRILLALFVIGVLLLAIRAVVDPGVPLLVESGGARWIRAPGGFSPLMRRPSVERSYFRTRSSGTAGRASLRAFRSAVVSVDGAVVHETARGGANWKESGSFELPPSNGELLVVAQNENAPPAILLSSPSLGLHTDETWEASADGLHWAPAALVDAPVDLPIWDERDTVAAAFAKTLPWQGGIVLVVVLAMLLRIRRLATASKLRWILLAAWTVLAVNNIGKLPLRHGFDVQDHVGYVRFLIEHGRLPLADEGWQFFQAPFFYLVSAVVSPLVEWADPSLERGLRVVPLLCGALQIEIAYRIARLGFPNREDLQSVALLVGGFLPMNLYMSQAVGNEPMFAVLSSLVLLQCVKMLRAPPVNARALLAPGVLLGLALLAKATGVLLVPILIVVVLSSAGRRRIAALSTTLGSALAVAGWFYLRNWIHFGKPILVGWDAETGLGWWQDPGYRAPEDLLRFGFSLQTPVLAAVRGFWDGLYSSLWADGGLSGVIGYPPWNYPFLFSVTWLALPVTAAMIAGAVVPVPEESAPTRSLALLAVLTFLLALLLVYLEVPIYVASKASYMLGITPCLGILAAAGFRPILASRTGRGATACLFAVLTVFVFTAYLVV